MSFTHRVYTCYPVGVDPTVAKGVAIAGGEDGSVGHALLPEPPTVGQEVLLRPHMKRVRVLAVSGNDLNIDGFTKNEITT